MNTRCCRSLYIMLVATSAEAQTKLYLVHLYRTSKRVSIVHRPTSVVLVVACMAARIRLPKLVGQKVGIE